MGGSSQGLKISPRIPVRRRRRLPVKGVVNVRVGETVAMDTVVARAEIPGAFHAIPAAAKLGISPSELRTAMAVREGDAVRAKDHLARIPSLFGLLQRIVAAPVDGVVESVSAVTGQIVLREKPIPYELIAYLPGEVVDSDGGTWVDIAAAVCLVQGIFGVGGEVQGRLRRLGGAPGEPLEAGAISADDAEGVILTGGSVDATTLRALVDAGARGVVAASAEGSELMRWAGSALNPASTGREELGLTVVLTEGFGDLPMMGRTFELLSALDGKAVSVSGVTQIRAGVIRPEVLSSPLSAVTSTDTAETTAEIAPGDRVRVIRGAAFGRIGEVRRIPRKLVRIATGARALVYEISVDGEAHLIPRQNVERIDTDKA